jgi:hypothetical protein
MAGVYYLLQDSVTFDDIVHGRRSRSNKVLKKRDMEDFRELMLSQVRFVSID